MYLLITYVVPLWTIENPMKGGISLNNIPTLLSLIVSMGIGYLVWSKSKEYLVNKFC